MSSTIIKNPIIWADVPDIDMIRVEDTFYMVSTSMHSMPGCPIMKSVNLKDWEIMNYVFDTIEDNDAHNLSTVKAFTGKAHGLPACDFITEPFMFASPVMIASSSICTGHGISRTAHGSARSLTGFSMIRAAV